MSVYKKEKPEYLKTAIDSMLFQTMIPDEIVIVKDGNLTPELDMVLEKYLNDQPEHFNIVGYEKNRGLGLALNYGLGKCKNQIVARMDTDDIALPDRCEKQLKMFEENKELEIVGGDIAEFVDVPTNIIAYRRVPTTDKSIKDYMKIRCPFNHMAVMFKKAAVIKAGNYQDWYCNEDYYLWIRMLEAKCVFSNIGDVLVNVRVGADTYSRRGGKEYFTSEIKLQKYMLDNNIIGYLRYILNVSKRVIIQRIFPNRIRFWVFRKFAREKI